MKSLDELTFRLGRLQRLIDAGEYAMAYGVAQQVELLAGEVKAEVRDRADQEAGRSGEREVGERGERRGLVGANAD